ncbi:4-hydroxy-tetrahydrodipicolinate synthase [Streptomyces sp. DvalAA-14]|uniref:dihydrodipicolinate synthase family protein n=1 Tax=unclassified Streptomyces TaxID=2593676 RepID=UPI00081B81C6|nr:MULTISPECIES: dihydrodipicolinate synthase family protein [unclassified Streptomyces]MYS22432.1 dihydrodipicolinate synthase family protein [Streptomyces sp. SID4948]SCE16100.1 4-hydroxy-tetrahydrodipicolinate synthase [Streptomyces sp. DvalAA-14]
MFHGVVPPLCTPLTEDGEVDTRSLERLTAFQLDAGVHGLFVGGSTGEAAQLTDRERDTALRTVVATAAGQVPVLAGAIDTGTRRVLEHARRAQALGAAAVVVTAPFYVGVGAAEVRAHYELLHAALDLPLVAYDIPANVGYKLPSDLVAELAQQKVIVAVKDSSGDLAGFQRVVDGAAASGLDCLTGSETLADLAMARGADGIVPGLGNVDPHGYVRLHRAARAGDFAAARDEQRRLTALFTITDIADRSRVGRISGALGAFKAALVARGVIAGPRTQSPLLPLTEAEGRAVAERVAAAGLGRID